MRKKHIMQKNTDYKQRIGIMGGTFNPIHIGHMIIAQNALEDLGLSKIMFIPCAIPPHKDATPVVSAEHRKQMVLLAIEDSLFFEESDIELNRDGPSFAIDTIRSLYDKSPDTEFFFIIGSDSLKELYLWKDIYSLLPLCRFITYSRPGTDVTELKEADIFLDKPWPKRLLQDVYRGRHIEISSSDIRYRLAEGLSIQYIVPEPVVMYIYEHGLYGSKD
jgi:nicotinate-nucleotide adenylyltransferase